MNKMTNEIKKTALLDFGRGDKLSPMDVYGQTRLPFNRELNIIPEIDKKTQKMLDKIGVSDFSLSMPIPAITVFAAFKKKPTLRFNDHMNMYQLHFNVKIASCDLIDQVGLASGGDVVGSKMASTLYFASQQYSAYGDLWFYPDSFEPVEDQLKISKADLKVIDQEGYEDPIVTNNYFPKRAMKIMKDEGLDKPNELTALFHDIKTYLGVDYKINGKLRHEPVEPDGAYEDGLRTVQEIKDELQAESSTPLENYFD